MQKAGAFFTDKSSRLKRGTGNLPQGQICTCCHTAGSQGTAAQSAKVCRDQQMTRECSFSSRSAGFDVLWVQRSTPQSRTFRYENPNPEATLAEKATVEHQTARTLLCVRQRRVADRHSHLIFVALVEPEAIHAV